MSPGLPNVQRKIIGSAQKKKVFFFTEIVVRLEGFTDFEEYLVKHG